MFSDVIKQALEREVVGQAQAVNAVVRGVTRLISGLTPRDRPLCAYLLMGPPSTGKTHLVHALSSILHGPGRRAMVADCRHFSPGDPWLSLTSQLAPAFTVLGQAQPGIAEPPPLSILLVECVDRGPQEVHRGLAAAIETGQLMLPGGRAGSLRNCLVFLTTGLCTREILDEAPRIGFSGSQDDDTGDDVADRVYEYCLEQAEKHFGMDLIGRLDRLIVFHRLEEQHLPEILDRRVARVNRWLDLRRLRCELQPAARAFLIERGRRNLRLGARDLVRAHRSFVEFPLADLLVSGRVPPGGLVLIDRNDGQEHLHFTVTRTAASESSGPTSEVREVPVVWDAPARPGATA